MGKEEERTLSSQQHYNSANQIPPSGRDDKAIVMTGKEEADKGSLGMGMPYSPLITHQPAPLSSSLPLSPLSSPPEAFPAHRSPLTTHHSHLWQKV